MREHMFFEGWLLMLASERKLCVGAVLLAAGAGSRLGHKPKSLLELDGVPLIHRQLAADRKSVV